MTETTKTLTPQIPTTTRQEIDAINFEAWELKDDDPQQAFSLGTKAYQQSSGAEPYSKGMAQSLSTLGYLNHYKGNFELALSQSLEAVALFKIKLFIILR